MVLVHRTSVVHENANIEVGTKNRVIRVCLLTFVKSVGLVFR